ncbi:M15 family metallopeptidase [Congregibacter brevis]|uniref:M15 family metallopeptidase n=1 Tax=Congregibacter brevis TaxID=3081201 RepID=A0ABZ0IEV7_9GAMM|nr:M15 family metallopeptidase [Congregibacter sp. IMCC45268]
MSLSVFQRQLLGLHESALQERGGHRLQAPVWAALQCLTDAAVEAGFRLEVASAYRSYERQLAIWNTKLAGGRPVLDDDDQVVDLATLSEEECIRCVLRFSAMPGASRHHWGTDLDVFDAAAVGDDYRVQLSLAEVAASGPFGPLHEWLDQRIAAGESFGFYRPYDEDRGGVAAERWHLSYAPLAMPYEQASSAEVLRLAWLESGLENLAAREVLDSQLESLFERFVMRVAEPPDNALNYLPPA